MNATQKANQPETPPSPWLATSLLMIVVTAAGVAVGWIAFLLASSGFSPAILFSLALGAIVGGLAAVGGVLLGVLDQRVVLSVALLAAFATIVTQHTLFYRQAVKQREEAMQRFEPRDPLEMQAQQEFVRAPTPWQFFRAGSTARKVWWLVDAVLCLIASLAVSWYGVRSATAGRFPSHQRSPSAKENSS